MKTYQQLSEEQQHVCSLKINEDIIDRSMPGAIIILALWACVAYLIYNRSESIETNQWLINFSIVLMLAASIRFGLILLAKKYLNHHFLCQSLIFSGVLVGCFPWGVMAACSHMDTPLSPHQDIILLATIGLSAGGAVAFSLSRLFTCLYVCSLLFPVLFFQLFMIEEMSIEITLIVTLYILGLLVVTLNPHKEYMSSLISNFQLSEIGFTDGLTGVRNRRFFDTQLYEEVQRAKRNKSYLTLLIADIDYFKQINDKYGHQAGDECLVEFARLLGETVSRISDTVSRYGGEEFAIILPNTTGDDGSKLADKIRHIIENNNINIDGGSIQITVSIGVSCINNIDDRYEPLELISSADQALYRAKELGRNRVELNI